MSGSVLVLVPIALLAIVVLLGFVGCGKPFTIAPYGDQILAIKGLTAYWPLNELAGPKAIDKKGGHDGAYLDKNLPPPEDALFPIPAVSLASMPPSPHPGAGAPGTLMFGQPTIMHGDPWSATVKLDGGFVRVPWDAAFNPPEFTVEAWVQPGWVTGDGTLRVVIDSRQAAGGHVFGFALYATEGGLWEAVIGTGGAGGVEQVTATGPMVKTTETAYLAVTFAGGALSLLVDGLSAGSVPANYAPNTGVDLFIGMGAPFLPQRSQPQPPGTLTGPLFPFKGTIQDVAVYNRVLNAEEIGGNRTGGKGA